MDARRLLSYIAIAIHTPSIALYMYDMLQVDTCGKCQKNKKKLQKSSGTLHPIAVKPQFWQQVGMDLVGPLNETPRENKYIVTLTDYFTKWVEAAAPPPDKCAASVAQFIYSMMCRHGCPEVFITDQGREFVYDMSQELYSITRTEHRITSAYHPQVSKHCNMFYIYVCNYNIDILTFIQTNGLTEQCNHTLSRCLAKVIDENQLNGDLKLDTCNGCHEPPVCRTLCVVLLVVCTVLWFIARHVVLLGARGVVITTCVRHMCYYY